MGVKKEQFEDELEHIDIIEDEGDENMLVEDYLVKQYEMQVCSIT
jgi:hypothetical protein